MVLDFLVGLLSLCFMLNQLPQSSYSCPITIAMACQLISGERRDVLLPFSPARSPERSVLNLWICGVFTAGMTAGLFLRAAPACWTDAETFSMDILIGGSSRHDLSSSELCFHPLILYFLLQPQQSRLSVGWWDFIFYLFIFLICAWALRGENRKPGMAGGRRGERCRNSIRQD